jgi:hypothetical protein
MTNLNSSTLEMAKTALIKKFGSVQAAVEYTNNFDLETNGDFIWVKGYEDVKAWHYDHLAELIEV